jgi:rod shape-determining protein MreB
MAEQRPSGLSPSRASGYPSAGAVRRIRESATIWALTGHGNTLVHVRDRGIVISEPSVVAIEAKSKRVLAIGAEAKRMVGRTPANIIAIRPLRDGVISDFDVTEQMIRYFVDKVHDRSDSRPRVLVDSVGVTEVERRGAGRNDECRARWARLIEDAGRGHRRGCR